MTDDERQAIVARLAELHKRDGNLSADAVIADAKSDESPLHGCFEWDVEAAAMEHWREQARELIRSVHLDVIVENVSIVVPVYVRDPRAEPDEQSYVAVSKIRSNKDQAQAALMYELDRAAGAMERARRVAVALGLERDVSRLMAQIEKVKRKAAE